MDELAHAVLHRLLLARHTAICQRVICVNRGGLTRANDYEPLQRRLVCGFNDLSRYAVRLATLNADNCHFFANHCTRMNRKLVVLFERGRLLRWCRRAVLSPCG